MIVSGLACREVGLVTAALDLSFNLWSWAFGPASSLISNYDCFRTCMSGCWTCDRSIGLVIMKLGLRPSFILNVKLWLFLDLHWTRHCSTGLVVLKLGLRPSFILNINSWLFPHLHVGTLDLWPQHWTCHSPHQIMIISGLACWHVGLVTAALDLSLWSWAFGPA